MSGTAPSSGLPPVSAKVPWSCSSCTSIWRRSNDALHTEETRMTEISARSPAEGLVTKLRAMQVFADLQQDDLFWFVAQCTEHRAEKLAALGKLAAGLAKERKSRSGAARRSAGALRDCLARLRAAAHSTTIGPNDCAKLAQTEEEIRSSLKPAQFKDEFARVEREEAIQSWLESHNVPEAWKLAPHLADANLTDTHLARFAEAACTSVGSQPTRFAT